MRGISSRPLVCRLWLPASIGLDLDESGVWRHISPVKGIFVGDTSRDCLIFCEKTAAAKKSGFLGFLTRCETVVWCRRRESNPHAALRRGKSYPLDDGDKPIDSLHAQPHPDLGNRDG
jgi:hypothetical protein